MPGSHETFHAATLAGAELGDVRVLDAQWEDDVVTLWFGQTDRRFQPTLTKNGAALDIEAIPGGFRAKIPSDVDPALTIGGAKLAISPTKIEPHVFDNAAVLLGLRHFESVGDVVRWIEYHARLHGADAALVLNLGDPASRADFENDLKSALSKKDRAETVVVVTSPIPLGHRNLPSAAHPFNSPAAPGKDRMSDLEPDPETSPLGEPLIFEALHQRFLTGARAVLSLDVSDLLLPSPADQSIFDRAEQTEGYLSITGREIYPWRRPKDREIAHPDHTCVQFDRAARRRRWAVAPGRVPNGLWRFNRIGNARAVDDPAEFVRCTALRHPEVPVSSLVPKTALVEDPDLVALARDEFGHDPIRVPKADFKPASVSGGHVTVVTCMKNEGPFILEWLAYHRAIGVDRFLVYSNDCDDGTDVLLDLLQKRGFLQHRDNPYRQTGQRPQHAAFHAAEDEPSVKDADWLVTMDVDEFINIHVGEGRITDLFLAVPNANMISMTWRLFGNADIHTFEDRPVTELFHQCAPQLARKPHQAWGFKTLFRRQGLFKKIGVHRPKGLVPQLKDHINWVNGSGQPMPEADYRNAWRSTVSTFGYDLVTLNHYAVRSVESFLVKRDRGRVNHVDRDQGHIYWFRMNNNEVSDRSIEPRLAAMRTELADLLDDPEISTAHAHCVARHRQKIAELRARPDYAEFFAELTSPRMEKLSRLHKHFGSGVFWSGPQVVPDEIVSRDPDEEFFFTVDPIGKGH